MSPVLTQHVSQPITLDEQTQKMKRHLLQDIRRSAYVYRVACGGCNACDMCSSLICADCCCECMGGDLISCC